MEKFLKNIILGIICVMFFFFLIGNMTLQGANTELIIVLDAFRSFHIGSIIKYSILLLGVFLAPIGVNTLIEVIRENGLSELIGFYDDEK